MSKTKKKRSAEFKTKAAIQEKCLSLSSLLHFSHPIPVSDPSECAWYQTFDWPDGSVVKGRWDYRHTVDALLGNIDYSGKTVLEIGPASGFFTVEIERRGGAVVCIDTSDEEPWEIVPRRDVDVEEFLDDRRRGQLMLRRAWWLTQKTFNRSARISYCGVGALPTLAGHVQFDVCFVSCVLQHFRSPIEVLFHISDLAQQVVITEPFVPRLEALGMAEFYPSPQNQNVDSWWLLSSKIVGNVMTMRGFEQLSHERNMVRRWDLIDPGIEHDTYRDVEFYTSVFRKQ